MRCSLSLTPLSLLTHSHAHSHSYIIYYSLSSEIAIRATRINIISERVYFSSTVRHPELQHFGGQEGQEHQGKPILMSGITLSLSLSHTLTHIHTTTYSARSPFSLSMWKSVLCACMRFPVGRSRGPAPIAAPRAPLLQKRWIYDFGPLCSCWIRTKPTHVRARMKRI